MTYYEIQNVYQEHIQSKELKEMLEQSGDTYYFILHDKDERLDGSTHKMVLKKPHYHIIIGTNENSRTAKQSLTSMFQSVSEKVIINNIRNLQKFMRYLRHQDDKSKHQYSRDEIITNDIEGYDEITAQFIKPMSETDTLLEEFIVWCCELGCVPTYLDVLAFWRKRNSLSYFVQHQKQLLDMANNLTIAEDNDVKTMLSNCEINDIMEVLQ